MPQYQVRSACEPQENDVSDASRVVQCEERHPIVHRKCSWKAFIEIDGEHTKPNSQNWRQKEQWGEECGTHVGVSAEAVYQSHLRAQFATQQWVPLAEEHLEVASAPAQNMEITCQMASAYCYRHSF